MRKRDKRALAFCALVIGIGGMGTFGLSQSLTASFFISALVSVGLLLIPRVRRVLRRLSGDDTGDWTGYFDN